MNLPTPAEVNAAARHAGSFAAGAVAMFGLQSKIDPATVVAIVNSLGNLTNDAVLLIGLVTPLVTAYLASRSASPDAQKKAVSLQPNTIVVQTQDNASTLKVANSVAAISEVQNVVTTPAVAIAAGPVGDGAKVVSKP